MASGLGLEPRTRLSTECRFGALFRSGISRVSWGHSSTRVRQHIYIHVRDDMFDPF